ncbi:substrate-binding domain-containing protein [Geodermatophilus sp. Leaf369]|jgi:ABC-type sugar transport system substrate-binding protein|uniref:sugar ABC transporter substrate-binding protein n=1 Tax=Geodermatophilus sp. Leaf369 TaxID=1736354 RepID=UPI0009E81BFF|nr:substrate-binding domain-containing protein [Geodermatophilus sp. Leaf369]
MLSSPRVRRTLTAVAAGTATLTLLAACGGGDDTSAADGEGASTVAAVIKGLDNPFFQAMEDGINAAADEQGVDVTVQAAQSITDTTGQADRLTALAQQDFGCYVVNPISGSNLVQGLAQIARQDVPIVNIDSPVDADAAEEAGADITTYIGTDNSDAGAQAGQQMIDAVGSGQVAVIGGIAGDVTSGARVDGFTGAVDGTLDVVQTVAADWERQKALTAATDILAANPDLVGFFAANDDMGLGIARAVANAGRTGEVAVISVDGNEEALQAVADGELTATVAQYPYAIGQMGVEACVAATQGADLPAEVTAPVAVVTTENAADALAAFPAPFEEFEDPLADLIQ